MLSPEARTVAMEFLRPPPGYHLDVALLTTYTLDLEALLALPLGVLAQADEELETLLADPLLLLEALRQAGQRVHVFVDEGGIAIPRTHRELYAMLESSVHPVRAPGGGAFHPKVWVIRYSKEGTGSGNPLLRVGVMSRNLTFDRSWDIALASEASSFGRRRMRASQPLGELLRTLPRLTTEDLSDSVRAMIQEVAGQIERTRFPAPQGFGPPVEFHLLGISRQRSPWCPMTGGSRLLVMTPFVNRTGLDAVAGMSNGRRLLVSRQEELDRLTEEALGDWNRDGDRILVLQEADLGEVEDGASPLLSGLHAKVIAVEHGWDVTWYVGSANLTGAAFTGANVEMMAAVTGRKGRKSGRSGSGIERFLESGFDALCVNYRRSELEKEDQNESRARKLLNETKHRLVNTPLRIVCKPLESNFTWALEGTVSLPSEVNVVVWPVSVSENRARSLELPVTQLLPVSRLTAFVAFRLSVAHIAVEDVRMTLKLPTVGMPEGRINSVLRTLIDSPEKFLRLLRALLGGLEGMVGWDHRGSGSKPAGDWGNGRRAETLLEDLMHTASQEPERLEPIRRLIKELRETEEGRRIVPDDLLDLWNAVDKAIGGRST